MDTRFPDDAAICDYLLGRLDPESETVARVDELLLTNLEFSENVGVVEDELIEEYLEGALGPAERQSFETHFLRPQARQRKLQNARLLTRRLAVAATSPEARQLLQVPPSVRPVVPLRPRPRFRLYAEIAAALLLAASLIYLSQSRARLQSSLGVSIQQLAQEREHSALLSQQLQAARDLAPPFTATLILFRPGISRSSYDSVPVLHVGAAIKDVHVELALTSSVRGPCRIQLESLGKIVWFVDSIYPVVSAGGAILTFTVPAGALAAGENEVTVSQSSAPTATYYFEVSRD
jgi:hypothetical protein